MKISEAPATTIAKARLVWLLVAILAVLGGASARAALQFDVFLGYDGTVREASWFPVVCEIRNDGPPITGLIEVSPGSYGKGQTQQMPVELPTGTTKRLVIPAFATGRYPSRWNVRLVDDRGKVRAEQVAVGMRRHVGCEIPLLGSLSRTAAGAPQLRPIPDKQNIETQPASARFQAPIFPDNPLVLEGLDAIYLSSEIAADLRVSQVNAILGWLNAGGHLIVGIEQVNDINASPWLRAILPCEPKETRVLPSHPELQQWLQRGWSARAITGYRTRVIQGTPVRPGEPADRSFASLAHDPAFEIAELPALTCSLKDGKVVLGVGQVPLIIAANRGQGRVTALLFSPEREPFKSWKNLPTFWSKLIEVPEMLYTSSSDYYQSYGQSADGVFGAMIDSRQVHKLPIGWLLLLLLAYLLVIGPLDQWWLKRIGKPMLTWITFPCYVVLFSLLIYFIGYKLRAGESEYNELHVVDVLRNDDRAELRGRTYATIYSPSNEKYLMESHQKFATLRGEFLGAGGAQANEKATIWQNGDSFKAEVFVPVWTSQLYISDWWHTASQPLTVKVSARDTGWNVSVQNHTTQPAKEVQLVIEDRVYPIGELGAGQTRTLTVARESGTDLQEFVTRHSQNFHHAAQQRQYAFGESRGGQISDLANASMAASFVTQVSGGQNYNNMGFVASPGLDLSRVVERGNAVLLAWMPDYAPVKPMNQFRPKRSFHHTLWRVPVEITN